MTITRLGRYRELPYGGPEGESIHRTLKLDIARKARVVAYLRDAPVLAASGILGTDPPKLTDEELIALADSLYPK